MKGNIAVRRSLVLRSLLTFNEAMRLPPEVRLKRIRKIKRSIVYQTAYSLSGRLLVLKHQSLPEKVIRNKITRSARTN